MGTGYIAFPVLRGAYKEFTITIDFRPGTSNGLLMFSGEHPNARSDFFSISLIDGHAEFRLVDIFHKYHSYHSIFVSSSL